MRGIVIIGAGAVSGKASLMASALAAKGVDVVIVFEDYSPEQSLQAIQGRLEAVFIEPLPKMIDCIKIEKILPPPTETRFIKQQNKYRARHHNNSFRSKKLR